MIDKPRLQILHKIGADVHLDVRLVFVGLGRFSEQRAYVRTRRGVSATITVH